MPQRENLLRRLGHEVDFPDQQTCCGQVHFNTGCQDDCIPMAERHGAGVLIGTGRAGGLYAAGRRAKAVAARTYELSELLIDALGITDTGSYFPHRVTITHVPHAADAQGR